MPAFRTSLSVLLLVAALPAAAQEAPVREVVLFEAGLAELTRETGTAGEVVLSVPLRDVNDVLKSLLVRGTGITGARIELAGESPVEDAFAGLPFPPEAATDFLALLREVPGLRVRVTEPGSQPREATVMGVTQDCTELVGCSTLVMLLGEDGTLRRLRLDGGVGLQILDEEIVEALGRGLGALREAASGTVREIRVTLEGAEVADGALTYVVAAPVWKTAYRALTGPGGGVDLQAWAVIENATGEDWEDVGLTLSSGSPVTLAADLHGRDWRSRPVVEPEPVMVMEPEAPALRQEFAGDAVAGAEAGFAAPAPSPVVAAAGTSEGVLDSRFAFDEPVDLGAGEMLSLPFLTEGLGATHLSLWQGQLFTRTGNPDMVLEVVNDLEVRLPAGIMTVSDEAGGYVGDADFPLVGPGETEAVPFGVDRNLRVEETATETTRQVSVRAAEGVLTITQEQVREVGYLVTSPSGEAGELVVDHPLTQGWRTEVVIGPEGEERQDDDGRRWLRVDLPVGAEGALLRVRDVHPYEQVVEIGTLDEATVLAWVGQATDDATRVYLEEAAGLMRGLDRAEDALAEAEAAGARLANEQERVRRLLGSVPQPSEAYDRFLGSLLELEDRIAAGTAEAEALRVAAEAARAALEAHLAG